MSAFLHVGAPCNSSLTEVQGKLPWSVSICWTGIWNGTVEWKIEWNGECTKLLLTGVTGTVQSRLS